MPKSCSKPGCNRDRASTHNYCAEHWAEYQREYGQRRIKNSFEHGMRQGVEACARFLRERLGERAVSGREAAQLLLRVSQNGDETPEVAQRRAMIESLRRSDLSQPQKGML